MKRNEWEVKYTGRRLAEAAQAKKTYHAERHKVWSGKEEDVMVEIKSSGMEINRSLVDEMRKTNQYSISNSANLGFPSTTVTIRADLLQKLQEAGLKIRQHEDLIKQYDAWVQMMEAHQENQFELNHDDWMFFFGK